MTITLTCPIDGLPLGTVNLAPQPVRGDATDRVGDHVHLATAVDSRCANGHRWVSDDNMVLTRVA